MTLLNLTSLDTDATIDFEWEAWKAGTTNLYIIIDDDSSNLIPVKEFVVNGADASSGAGTTTVLLVAVVGVLVVVVIGLLSVIVLRKPSESMDEYLDEEIWDDGGEDNYGTTARIRLDYEEDTLWNTVSRHGIFDKDAFLAHAYRYDRDDDGFLDAEELDRAAIDFTSLMTQSTTTNDVEYPFDFNDETVAHVIASHGIHDKDAFLEFAQAYDEDQNGYLKHSELSRAAADFAASDENTPAPDETNPDPRLLSVAEVRSALPDWSESTIHEWMDKGWSAKQIIDHHSQPVQPPAPPGFGDEYVEVEPEPVDEQVEEPTTEITHTPSTLKRLKKAELVELAELQGLDSSGTKAQIIERLLG